MSDKERYAVISLEIKLEEKTLTVHPLTAKLSSVQRDDEEWQEAASEAPSRSFYGYGRSEEAALLNLAGKVLGVE